MMNIMNRFNVDIPAAVTVAHRPFILAVAAARHAAPAPALQ
jgi:hypothetical protein